METTRKPVTEESLQEGMGVMARHAGTVEFVGKKNAAPKGNMAQDQPRDEKGQWTSGGVVDIAKQAEYISSHFAGKMKKHGWKDEGDGRATKRFAHLVEPGIMQTDGGRVLTAMIERGMPVIKMGDEYVVGAFGVQQGHDSQSQADHFNDAAEKYVAKREAFWERAKA